MQFRFNFFQIRPYYMLQARTHFSNFCTKLTYLRIRWNMDVSRMVLACGTTGLRSHWRAWLRSFRPTRTTRNLRSWNSSYERCLIVLFRRIQFNSSLFETIKYYQSFCCEISLKYWFIITFVTPTPHTSMRCQASVYASTGWMAASGFPTALDDQPFWELSHVVTIKQLSIHGNLKQVLVTRGSSWCLPASDYGKDAGNWKPLQP